LRQQIKFLDRVYYGNDFKNESGLRKSISYRWLFLANYRLSFQTNGSSFIKQLYLSSPMKPQFQILKNKKATPNEVAFNIYLKR